MFCCDTHGEIFDAFHGKKIALVGNTNSGKTTLFNTITGLSQHVSNYPGTTVSVFESVLETPRGKMLLCDLPGVYSLSPYSSEEWVSRDILLHKKFDTIICVVDPAHLIRSLSLALELLEMGMPLIFCINKLKNQSVAHNLAEKLTEVFHVPAYILDASHDSAKEVIVNAIHSYQTSPINEETVSIVHASLMPQIAQVRTHKQVQHLWEALQVLELGEDYEHCKIPTTRRKDNTFVHAVRKNRYDFIQKHFLGLHTPLHPLSQKIDAYLLNPWFGIPAFLGLVWIMFQTTFTFSAPLTDALESFMAFLSSTVASVLPESLFTSLLIDGIIGGVGAVVVFIPQIIILFLFLGILEQSGYLARAAFILEHVMQKVGVHGKSAVALLMGFGCNVPAIMSLRTLPTRRERIITAAMIPFMSCSARFPILILFIGTFVSPAFQGTTLFGLYVLGVLASFLTAYLLKYSLKSTAKPLILELPEYRLPPLRTLFVSAWAAVKHFLKRAGRIIIPFTIVSWILFSFPTGVGVEGSYAATVGKTIAPILAPLGFDWRITTGLISGLGAKENYIATLATLYSLADDNTLSLSAKLLADPVFTPATIASLLVFMLLYTPCVSVITVLYGEIGKRWALFGLIYPTVFAFFMAWLTHIFISAL